MRVVNALFVAVLLCVALTSPVARAQDRNQELRNQELHSPLVAEALKYFSAKKYAQAVVSFQQAITSDPNNSFAHYGLGLSYSNLRKWRQSAEAVRRSLQLNPHPKWGDVNERLVRSLLAEAETNAKASQESEQVLDDLTIKVEEGTFVFTNLRLKNEKYSGFTLNGEVVNETNKDWSQVRFAIEGLDEAGRTIENPFNRLNDVTLYSFKRGETQSIDATSGKSLSGFENKQLARLNIEFADGKYPAKYTFSMLRPTPSSELLYADAFVRIEFVISTREISFVLENKTENPIRIDWNQVSYIDISKETHKVMHKGVKYVNRSETQAPSVIPPTANLNDIVFPIDYVSYSSSRYSSGWNADALFPDGARAAAYKGQSFSIFMPLEINGNVKNYLFTFKILDVER